MVGARMRCGWLRGGKLLYADMTLSIYSRYLVGYWGDGRVLKGRKVQMALTKNCAALLIMSKCTPFHL
jgi:hypothetical protein